MGAGVVVDAGRAGVEAGRRAAERAGAGRRAPKPPKPPPLRER